jgi:hypothetical protein
MEEDMNSFLTNDPMNSCGLVVVFPDDAATMWDSDVNGMVGEIENQIDGPFVTFALLNGHQPSLMDALTATQFVGCTSAVVAVVGATGQTVYDSMASGTEHFPITVTACDRSAASVTDAFMDVILAEPAACA